VFTKAVWLALVGEQTHMAKAFERRLRFVRQRCSVNLLIRQAGRVLAAAGLIALLTILAERLLAVSIIQPWTPWAFSGLVATLVLSLWLLKLPSRMQASLLLDRRLKLHERFSTTLALAESKDPFAAACRREARDRARGVDLRGHFPIRPSTCWLYAGGTWLVAVAVLFMPQQDLLGLLRKRQQQQDQAQQVQQAQVDVNDATNPVKLAVKQLGDPNLAEELSELDQLPKDAKPEEIKRQAIRKLGDLSDKIKNMQTTAQLDAANMLQQMLKQLRGSLDSFSQQLRLALAKGNFTQASNFLRQLQKQLSEGKLSDQQRQALSKQLQDLAKQLRELARQKEELEKELEKLGLDKRLAKLSEKQLRQALQKQGLSEDMMDQLLRKAAASRLASGWAAGLGQAMAGAGAGAAGLSADELADAIEQLDALEAIRQQVLLTEASLAEIRRAIAGLGEGMGWGLGFQGPFAEGLSDRWGPGTGGPGIGYGPRDSDSEGETSTKKTRVDGQTGQGPVIASWYFKDMQVKGEAKRDFSEVIQAGRDSAAEAISENQIPRKYEQAVKKYFSQLEESGPK